MKEVGLPKDMPSLKSLRNEYVKSLDKKDLEAARQQLKKEKIKPTGKKGQQTKLKLNDLPPNVLMLIC